MAHLSLELGSQEAGTICAMSKEIAAFVCSHVFENSHPILLVARENGDWMYLCGSLE